MNKLQRSDLPLLIGGYDCNDAESNAGLGLGWIAAGTLIVTGGPLGAGLVLGVLGFGATMYFLGC